MSIRSGFRVAALMADGFQEIEFTGPMGAVREAGAEVVARAG